jgi:hypothetical protein
MRIRKTSRTHSPDGAVQGTHTPLLVNLPGVKLSRPFESHL